MISFSITNIAGGNLHNFRTLTGAARFVAKNPVMGGYVIVGDEVRPDAEYDNALAVVRYAEQAHYEVGKDDWEKVVEKCITWFDDADSEEMEDEDY